MENESPLNTALRHFENAEANLSKLERLWKEIRAIIPDGVCFTDTDEAYEEKRLHYELILPHLPKIDNWRPENLPMDLNAIAGNRLDANELGEIDLIVGTEIDIFRPGDELHKYRFLLNKARRELIRETLLSQIDSIDSYLQNIQNSIDSPMDWEQLKEYVAKIDTLLGSEERPDRWKELHRHLAWAQKKDFDDIVKLDWPIVKKELLSNAYGENEPIPSQIDDLSALVSTKPSGNLMTKLNWESLSAEMFERLIFTLICNEKGYENPQWLTHSNAPDRGRDLSVSRIIIDPLAGALRHRIILQCKNWLSRSISVEDISTLVNQMKLWDDPKVDVCIIATTGRFTTDAVQLVEKLNNSDQSLRLEMWPESHLEMLLASRPGLIAQFNLR